MKNIKSFEAFAVVEAEAEKAPSQEHLDSQKEFDSKIATLTSKIKDALDDKSSDPKEINKAKLMLKITKLEKELENANWDLSKFDEEDVAEGYRPMTDAERQKKQYMDQQRQRLRDVEKKQQDRERLLALQRKKHEEDLRKRMNEDDVSYS
jgi:hypothetical protein